MLARTEAAGGISGLDLNLISRCFWYLMGSPARLPCTEGAPSAARPPGVQVPTQSRLFFRAGLRPVPNGPAWALTFPRASAESGGTSFPKGGRVEVYARDTRLL